MNRKKITPITSRCLVTLLSAVCAISIPLSGAEGLRLLPESAEALGKVGGRIANLSDPSVVRLNPANLSLIEGTEFMVSTSVLHGSTDYTSPGGATASMGAPWKYSGAIYLATNPADSPWAFGMGISSPFGLDIRWASDFQFNLANESKLIPIAFSPGASYQLSDCLTVGFGFDLTWSQLEFTQNYPWFSVVPGSPTGVQKLKGEGWGFAPVASIAWDMDERQRVSVVARAPMKTDYKGSYKVSNIPAPLTPVFASESVFRSEIEQPGSIGIGYSVDIKDDLRIGFDFEWIQNSTHDDIPIDIGANQLLLNGNDRVVLDWENSWNLGWGIEADVTECLTARGGYMYSKSPMPDQTFTPAVPANDRHLISTGLGLKHGCGTIDFAYLLGIYEDRDVRNNQVAAYNGDWEFMWHQFTLSYTRKF